MVNARHDCLRPVTEDELLRLIDEIYACVLEPDRWPLVTRKISDALRSIGGVIYAGSRTDLTKSYFAVVDNYAKEHTQGYLDRYITIDPREKFAHEHKLSLAYDDMINTEAERKQHEFYDWHRSHGSWYFIGGVVSLDPDTYCTIAFQRTRRQGHVGNEEIELYERLVPHIQRVVAIARRLGLIDLRRTAAEQALDQLPFGVLLINAGGRLIHVNGTAERILADGDGLTVRHGRLAASRHADGGQLERLVGASIDFSRIGTVEPGGAAPVSRPSGRRPYLVHVSPVGGRGANGVFTLEFPAAVVFITDPERKEQTPAEVLSRMYGLTPAESRMTAALLQGEDLRTYAEAAKVTLNTTRWRLKQIFAKTGCRSQSDLVRLLLQGPGMLHLGEAGAVSTANDGSRRS